MHVKLRVILAILPALIVIWAGSANGQDWQLEPSPTGEVLNGISSSSLTYAIAVGNNGTIVQFENQDAGTTMMSGTSKDLLDVYVSSPMMAVAAGIDTVLLWNGLVWEEIRSTDTFTLFTGTWISPEEDVVLYGILGASFDFVCPYFPDMPKPPPFCRTFGRALLAACGKSGDIKVITEDGDIYRVDNFLGDIDGTNPIHDEPGLLGLTAVHAPGLSCLPGSVPPRSLFAIRQFSEIWHFDGFSWENMNVPVTANQTLTAISGTGPGLVTAVGFEPGVVSGNEAVIWIFDGQNWAQDTSLRAGSAGLVDVSANIAQDTSFIFAADFDVSTIPSGAGLVSRVRAVGEEGIVLSNEELRPYLVSDLKVDLNLKTTEPYAFGQRLVYEALVINDGQQPLMNVDFHLGSDPREFAYVSDSCGLSMRVNTPTYVEMGRPIAVLDPGSALPCTISYDIVTQSASGFLAIFLIGYNLDDYNVLNNFKSIAIQANQAPLP